MKIKSEPEHKVWVLITYVQTPPLNVQSDIQWRYRVLNFFLHFVYVISDSKHGKSVLTLCFIETPFNTVTNRADPDQAALKRAA